MAEAKARLYDEVREEARRAAADEVRKIEESARAEAEEKSRMVISAAVQRYASEYVAERTVATVPLPSDEMKGRIIGREGRNIRALEAATGVDLIIDDTPEAVVISCFNPVRREIARLALTRLIADGRIHPTRIEEMVEKATSEIEQQCKEAGEQAAFDLGLPRLHPELIRLVGKLKFRSSNAQNLLQHSIEVGFLAGAMAAELDLPVKTARRAGLLHDIGKAIEQEAEGSHAAVGAATARKYGEPPRVVQAIAAHHGEVPPVDVLDHLVDAANVLSGQRPGARARDAGVVRPAPHRSRAGGPELPRRRAGLRHPGRPRGPRRRRELARLRSRGAPPVEGHRAQGRGRAGLPGPGPRLRHPRDPRHRLREIARSTSTRALRPGTFNWPAPGNMLAPS